jgi:hypothetical protein
MTKQIFKYRIPNEILFDFLDDVCIKTEKYYLIDMNSYKRIMFNQSYLDFCSTIIEFYQDSKRYYIEREFTYNSFTNIVRQICKNNKIAYTSKIKYTDSDYNIDYYVFLPTEEQLFDDIDIDDEV